MYFCTMISKAKLKELSTYKQQKTCDLEGVYVVEGSKMCEEALRSNATIRVLCATREWLEKNAYIIGNREGGMMVYEVAHSEMERISAQKTPNQVWMLLQRGTSASLPIHSEGLILALDKLQDPGNLGTIIRTADWFGVRHIVCSPDTVSQYNPKVVQATMGGIFRTEIVYDDLPNFLRQCRENGKPVYGALLNGTNVYQASLSSNAVLVIGNESRGISPEVQAEHTQGLLIPNRGGTCESLNASVAAAILCAEFLRNGG